MIADRETAAAARVHLTVWPAADLPSLLETNDAVVCCTRVAGARDAVHGVVGEILADALSSSAPDVAHTPTGKPYLAGHNPPHPMKFNLSHCGDVLIVALSRKSEVGVDVERVRAIPEWRRIADRVFDPATRELLFSEIACGADERDAFLRYWCRMEAIVKATGEGVFGRDTRDAANDAAVGRAQPRVIDLPDLPLPAGDARYRAALALCP
jgi:hypothetical protein